MGRLLPGVIGPAHPSFKTGKTVTYKGYVQLNSGKHRNKYEHRVVMEELINDGVNFPPGFTKGLGIPAGFEVHHFDAKRDHNCVENLMLLQECIHHAIAKFKRVHLPWYEKHLKAQGVPRKKKKGEKKWKP